MRLNDLRGNSPVRLGPGEVHLWLGSLEDDPDLAGAPLSEDEVRRAGAFRFERDRRRYRVGRGALRRLLARYTGGDPAELVIEADAFGKPRLRDAGGAVRFNLAHSGERVLYAVSADRELGVDLEAVAHEPRLPECAATITTADERRRIDSLDPAARSRALLRLWTAKEAFLKAIGTGLQIAPDRIEVPVSVMDGSADPVRVYWLDRPAVSARYRLHPFPDFENGCDCSAAVVIASPED